jgi:hypothetical protein
MDRLSPVTKYIHAHNLKISKFEKSEQYEFCKLIFDNIQAIKNNDIEAYMKLNFDIKILKKVGFFGKKDSYEQMAERVCKFFSIDSVFEYSAIGMDTRCHISYINPKGKDFIYDRLY